MLVILNKLDQVQLNPVLSLFIHGWFIASNIHRRGSHLKKLGHQWIRECSTEELIHIAQIPKCLEPQWCIYSECRGFHPDIVDLASQIYLNLLACILHLEQEMMLLVASIESWGLHIDHPVPHILESKDAIKPQWVIPFKCIQS